MRLLDWLLLLAHMAAFRIQYATYSAHLTTDPACRQHRAPRPGSRIDIYSRGVSCSPCMAARAFGRESHGSEPPAHRTKGETP